MQQRLLGSDQNLTFDLHQLNVWCKFAGMDNLTAIVYARVSTEEQAKFGASLDSQVQVLTDVANQRGWNVHVIREQASGKSMTRKARPLLNEALDMLASGKAQFLLAVRIDRISRNVAEFAKLMGIASKQSWALVLSDMDIDTTTPQGEFMANIQISVAQYERKLIGQRTKAGLAIKKAEGVQLGRRGSLPVEVVQRIKAERSAGSTLTAIANGLTDDNVPTAQGGKRWYASTIKKVLESNVWQEV